MNTKFVYKFVRYIIDLKGSGRLGTIIWTYMVLQLTRNNPWRNYDICRVELTWGSSLLWPITIDSLAPEAAVAESVVVLGWFHIRTKCAIFVPLEFTLGAASLPDWVALSQSRQAMMRMAMITWKQRQQSHAKLSRLAIKKVRCGNLQEEWQPQRKYRQSSVFPFFLRQNCRNCSNTVLVNV